MLSRSLNYAGTGYAITVNANDVILDLRGWTITSTGTASVTNQTAGIFATDRRNITIRNGTVRGFFRGIYLEESAPENAQNHLVENIRAEDSTFLGIQVKGRASVIRNNVVNGVGGATVFTAVRYGMSLTGQNLRVVENLVTRVIPFNNSGPKAIGIELIGAVGSMVERNRILNHPSGFTIYGTGLVVTNSDRSVVEGNTLVGWGVGLNISPAVDLSARSVYRDNTQAGCDIGFVTLDAAYDGGGNF